MWPGWPARWSSGEPTIVRRARRGPSSKHHRPYRRSSRPIRRRTATDRRTVVRPEYPAADRVSYDLIGTRAPAEGWHRCRQSVAPRPGSTPDARYRPLAHTVLRSACPSRSVLDRGVLRAVTKQGERCPLRLWRPAHIRSSAVPPVPAVVRPTGMYRLAATRTRGDAAEIGNR